MCHVIVTCFLGGGGGCSSLPGIRLEFGKRKYESPWLIGCWTLDSCTTSAFHYILLQRSLLKNILRHLKNVHVCDVQTQLIQYRSNCHDGYLNRFASFSYIGNISRIHSLQCVFIGQDKFVTLHLPDASLFSLGQAVLHLHCGLFVSFCISVGRSLITSSFTFFKRPGCVSALSSRMARPFTNHNLIWNWYNVFLV